MELRELEDDVVAIEKNGLAMFIHPAPQKSPCKSQDVKGSESTRVSVLLHAKAEKASLSMNETYVHSCM